jgi:hypothetical protein
MKITMRITGPSAASDDKLAVWIFDIERKGRCVIGKPAKAKPTSTEIEDVLYLLQDLDGFDGTTDKFFEILLTHGLLVKKGAGRPPNAGRLAKKQADLEPFAAVVQIKKQAGSETPTDRGEPLAAGYLASGMTDKSKYTRIVFDRGPDDRRHTRADVAKLNRSLARYHTKSKQTVNF